MSYWSSQKPVRRARAVDPAAIATAAIDLLDQGGFRALTVRAVAGRIAVAPASLYSRVNSVDDVFDLALDAALGRDPEIQKALAQADIHVLLIEYYHHLVRRPWACQVIGMRAPRGPNYLRFSERMIQLLSEMQVSAPLATAYALSNFVIGCATTASAANDEPEASIDNSLAPTYAQLHAVQDKTPEQIVEAGLSALVALWSQ